MVLGVVITASPLIAIGVSFFWAGGAISKKFTNWLYPPTQDAVANSSTLKAVTVASSPFLFSALAYPPSLVLVLVAPAPLLTLAFFPLSYLVAHSLASRVVDKAFSLFAGEVEVKETRDDEYRPLNTEEDDLCDSRNVEDSKEENSQDPSSIYSAARRLFDDPRKSVADATELAQQTWTYYYGPGGGSKED